MKVYIMIDAEGITGVVDFEIQVTPASPRYAEMRRLYMSDLNAAVEGALESNAEEIVVYDMHYDGHNVILEDLRPEAQLIIGNPPKIQSPPGIDESYDALIMIGYHSMTGTGKLLNHTYRLDMKALHLNGVLMGEIGLEAAMAGSRGVPLVMVSGDDGAEEETRELLGDVEFACVKQSTGEASALCLPPVQTANLIREKVRSALGRLGDFKPYATPRPYTIELEFFDGSSAARAVSIDGVEKSNETTVVMAGGDLQQLWEKFLSEYSALD
jgi:D-amino peptidase